jgi:hypothetical protein
MGILVGVGDLPFAVFSMEPQEGFGGCWPNPRNERLASAI